MSGRRGLTLGLAVIAAALPAATAQADQYTIVTKGSKRTLGTVKAIGPFQPTVDAGTEAAIRVFGQPTSRSKSGSVCKLGWKPLGLRIVFANFGGGDACALGKAQTAQAFGRLWNTPRGLRIGSSVKTLRKLYPGARRKGKTYTLSTGNAPYGEGTGVYALLAAKTNGSKVTAFSLFIGGAGE